MFNERIPVSDQDAQALAASIYETEAVEQLYKEALDSNASPQAITILLRERLKAIKEHKTLWNEILVRYVGADNASQFGKLYRFDIAKQVIFKTFIEGCPLCKS